MRWEDELAREFEYTRGNRRRERHVLGPIGEYARPDECAHPVEARVSRDVRPYVARCHDCGAGQTDAGEWVVRYA